MKRAVERNQLRFGKSELVRQRFTGCLIDEQKHFFGRTASGKRAADTAHAAVIPSLRQNVFPVAQLQPQVLKLENSVFQEKFFMNRSDLQVAILDIGKKKRSLRARFIEVFRIKGEERIDFRNSFKIALAEFIKGADDVFSHGKRNIFHQPAVPVERARR